MPLTGHRARILVKNQIVVRFPSGNSDVPMGSWPDGFRESDPACLSDTLTMRRETAAGLFRRA
jgi:hypothetical protein